ncbi:hypothetical protein [Halosegnis marinus]|uniref:Beta-1,4-mannosyl-glycoprotein beta-1,4-N-acetylglucosaminyltransferase n=1 Tax=Halosegnis marinus TaxID=3034023 RepID=A0ABD5ZK61_9EURY|nr:hypothetical protein [Halosegnis sp. DT85]
MLSKLSTAIRTLREDGAVSLLKHIRSDLFPARDRLREARGPSTDIYDCFIFYNEVEVLKLRLNELDDVVDKFVLVEATETFQGDDKELHFEQNREQFADFEDRIIHHVVEYPENLTSAWEREYYLRDSIHEALKIKSNISPEDELIISDADEVPRPRAVERGVNTSGIKILSQSLHYYYFNYVLDGGSLWLGPVMSKYRDLTSPQDFRDRYTQHREDIGGVPERPYLFVLQLLLSVGNQRRVTILPDAGWHFSYIGDVEYMIDKIETFSHTELNEEQFKDRERIERAIANGRDLFGEGLRFNAIDVGERLPAYLRVNEAEFSDYLYRDG